MAGVLVHSQCVWCEGHGRISRSGRMDLCDDVVCPECDGSGETTIKDPLCDARDAAIEYPNALRIEPIKKPRLLSWVTPDLVHLFNDDPVRPELCPEFRFRIGECLVLGNGDDVAAVICVAQCKEVPSTVAQMEAVAAKDASARIAVPYSVWSYEKGAGREIIQRTLNLVRGTRPYITRVVTLSPKTEMARRFHLSNGAIVFRENESSDNYEYLLHG